MFSSKKENGANCSKCWAQQLTIDKLERMTVYCTCAKCGQKHVVRIEKFGFLNIVLEYPKLEDYPDRPDF